MIVGFDLGRSMGVAYLSPNGEIESETWGFDGHRDRGKMYLDFSTRLAKIIALVEPRLVIYEEPQMRMSSAWAAIFYGQRAILLSTCERLRISWVPVHTSEWKKYAGLSGNAKKPQVAAAALERWPTMDIHQDEMDARFIALAGRHVVGWDSKESDQ